MRIVTVPRHSMSVAASAAPKLGPRVSPAEIASNAARDLRMVYLLLVDSFAGCTCPIPELFPSPTRAHLPSSAVNAPEVRVLGPFELVLPGGRRAGPWERPVARRLVQ